MSKDQMKKVEVIFCHAKSKRCNYMFTSAVKTKNMLSFSMKVES